MRHFKFFRGDPYLNYTIIPNWYEQYVLQKLSECYEMGTSPIDNAYHFELCGRSKCIIIRSVALEDEHPTENNVFIDYELYRINLRLPNEMETRSFSISYDDYIRIRERNERV